MTSGRINQNIGDTWWPIIQKFGADIRVAVNDAGGRNETTVLVPDDLVLSRGDTTRFKVWFKENQHFDFGGIRYGIKRAHFSYDSQGPVRPEVQGIGLIRGGMLVDRVGMPGVPQDTAARVTGYVEFDEALDLEMKRVEAPTHYTFTLRRGPALRMKRWLEEELTAFASAKLGVGAGRHESGERVRRDAERRALDELNRRARELGLVGLRGTAGGGGGGGGGGHPRRPITVVLAEPALPRPGTRRVDFGDVLSGISGQGSKQHGGRPRGSARYLPDTRRRRVGPLCRRA